MTWNAFDLRALHSCVRYIFNIPSHQHILLKFCNLGGQKGLYRIRSKFTVIKEKERERETGDAIMSLIYEPFISKAAHKRESCLETSMNFKGMQINAIQNIDFGENFGRALHFWGKRPDM